MRRLGSVIVITSAVVAYACGGGNDAKKDAAIDSHQRDAAVDAMADAHLDAPPDGPANRVALTVKDYLGWCEVQIGSGAYSPASATTVYEAPGVVQLTALAGSGYQLGSNMWHHTDGDSSGSGEAGSQTGSGSS